MKKMLEEVFYTSVGMALKGKEKAEEIAKKFVKSNAMDAKQGKVFVDKVIKSAEKTKKELSGKIDEAVKSAVNKMGLVTKKEVAALKSEIQKLKSELSKSKKTKKK